VAHLQQKDTILCDSALKRAISISMDNGMFNDFTWALTQWHEKFKKQGQTASAQRLAMWADPKKFTARTDFEAVQPKQVLEIPASRRAAIQKSERLRLGLGIGSVLLILFAIWRISIRRRNNNFTLYRERAAALAAARTYRRDAIANASYHASEDGTQLVIDRERRVLAMEVLFETEQPHLNPDLTFSDVCNRLKEPEPAFRSIVKKMYDVEFETWLEEWRIDEAIKQLNAGADLSNLHTNCGFKDAASFRKTFKKVTGLKPGSYLKWPKPPIR
jgi:AraC-like DNA-binding protein